MHSWLGHHRGHGNHYANELSSVAYWYAARPTKAAAPPTVEKRQPILRDNLGRWRYDRGNQCPGPKVKLTAEMKRVRSRWQKSNG